MVGSHGYRVNTAVEGRTSFVSSKDELFEYCLAEHPTVQSRVFSVLFVGRFSFSIVICCMVMD